MPTPTPAPTERLDPHGQSPLTGRGGGGLTRESWPDRGTFAWRDVRSEDDPDDGFLLSALFLVAAILSGAAAVGCIAVLIYWMH